MSTNTPGLIRSTGIAAIVAGLMFVVIQPLHPADVLASVSTDAWAIIHYATLVMLLLFVVGVTGIYARQVEELGVVGLAGFIVLTVGLLLTAIGGVIEAFVQPLIASTDPAFVQGMLDMVHGHETAVDLGAIPLVWNVSSAAFLGGTVLFGIANFRAGVLSRWASVLFAVGLFGSAPVAALVGNPRVAAVPIGIGLAWLGYSLLTERRERAPMKAPPATTPQSESAAAAA